jgi:hypothetical protein
MAEGIVYLDVDDEITSAASRIRNAPGTKVALVVPYGSRIATSRMNFRLLSREAVVSNRRLSIVSGDAAARSLAASAGLPVFATVPEYEEAIARPASTDAGDPATAPDATAGETTSEDADSASIVPGAVAGAAGLAASATVAAVGPAGSAEAAAQAATSAATAADAVPGRKSQRPRRPPPEPAAILSAADAGGAEPVHPGWAGADHPALDADAIDADGAERTGGRSRGPLIAAVGLAALAVVVLAVGAYLFLPSASIALTPRRDTIGPIELTVSADPDATDVDVANSVVPAIRLDVPVEAARTFTTTGTHVEESAAHGAVTFTNYDTSSGVTIRSGSIVSTEGGVRFKTQATVALQPAAVFPSFQPTSDSVAINAVKTGEGGNVPANTIRVVPEGQDPVLLRVNNPNSTSGGTHTETPEVTKAEVDKAMAALQVDLQKAFDAAIAAGAGAPADTTLFPDTAAIGQTTPDVDPKSLVGKAVATFDLKLTANGTVIAVDPTPVAAIARTDLETQVAQDHRLLADSVVIEVGAGTVGEDGQVTFQASARAVQVAIVDGDAVRALVKGKTAVEAKAALVSYGTAEVTLWPDWVSTVTGVDSRLSIAIDEGPADAGGDGASPGPSSSPRRSGSTGSPAASSAEPPAASATADASSAP